MIPLSDHQTQWNETGCAFIVLSTMLSFWLVAHTVTETGESDWGSLEVRFSSITPGESCHHAWWAIWVRLLLAGKLDFMSMLARKGIRETKIFLNLYILFPNHATGWLWSMIPASNLRLLGTDMISQTRTICLFKPMEMNLGVEKQETSLKKKKVYLTV